MAAFLVRRGSTSPESKTPPNTSRRRHHGSRTESRTRRPQNEHTNTSPYLHYSSHASPPRQSHSQPQSQPQNQWCPSPISMPGPSPSPSPSYLSTPLEHTGMAGITMERTPSGNSIISDTPMHYSSHNHHSTHTLTCADSDAARRVEKHFQNKRLSSSHRKHERYLKKLIRRDDPHDEGSIDNRALAGILTTADSLFFANTLSSRVQWEWSSAERYQHELIGTTALRRCPDRPGFETLIVLSHPILRNPAFDRRLLLSTFLHELIHCYLFINCGFEARMMGGHTDGFLRIARVIDNWVGEGFLGLCSVKADLDAFRKEKEKANYGGWEAKEGGWMERDERWEMGRKGEWGWGGRGRVESCMNCERSPRREGDDEAFVRGYV